LVKKRELVWIQGAGILAARGNLWGSRWGLGAHGAFSAFHPKSQANRVHWALLSPDERTRLMSALFGSGK
jgi:hypothetical protein